MKSYVIFPVKCPYCNKEHKLRKNKYLRNKRHYYTCKDCKNRFYFEPYINIKIHYNTFKSCELNKKEHEYTQTQLSKFDESFSKFDPCVHCGRKRQDGNHSV